MYIYNFDEFTWKGWARHSDCANQSRSRELADLHSSGESSSTCQCTQVYIGWLRGTVWVNKAVQAQPRLTAAPEPSAAFVSHRTYDTGRKLAPRLPDQEWTPRRETPLSEDMGDWSQLPCRWHSRAYLKSKVKSHGLLLPTPSSS